MNSKEYSRDALRLLYAIGAYSNPEGDLKHRLWMKMHCICVLALLGVKSGGFEDYDISPTLFPFRGIKMFAMISQEALEDVQTFFHDKLIDKILLNTWFYCTITGFAITEAGQRLVNASVTPEEREMLDEIIYCKQCRKPVDFAVTVQKEPRTHMVMNRVCRCQTGGRHTCNDEWLDCCCGLAETVDDFFSLGDVEYKGKPFYMETSL